MLIILRYGTVEYDIPYIYITQNYLLYKLRLLLKKLDAVTLNRLIIKQVFTPGFINSLKALSQTFIPATDPSYPNDNQFYKKKIILAPVGSLTLQDYLSTGLF